MKLSKNLLFVGRMDMETHFINLTYFASCAIEIFRLIDK